MKTIRNFLKAAIVVAAITLFGIGCNDNPAQIAKPYLATPNVILIVADDLGYYDLGCYGNRFIETPHLDRMAAEGVRFTQGYAAAPLCSPTRASIQTGLYPARIGMTEHIRGHPGARPWMPVVPVKSKQGLDSNYQTLPEIFASKDYTTAHIGKWHLGGGASMPEAQGYDFNFAGNWAGLPRSFFYPFFDQGVLEEVKAYSQDGEYLTDVLTRRAVEYITTERDQPYFLHLAYYSPHVPIEGKARWVEHYQRKRRPLADSLLPNVHYAAMIASIDENIGTLLDTLRSTGQDRNTLVIFTSDNGGLSVREVPGYDQHTPPTDNGVLKAGKGYLAEGGIREPFLFWLPGTLPANRVEDTPIISTDFLNTFAEMLGSEARSSDGRSLWGLLRGDDFAPRDLFWHHPHYSPQMGIPEAAVRSGSYKLIRDLGTQTAALYDLGSDPSEIHDLAGEEPVRYQAMQTKLDNWLRTVGAKMPEPNPDYDPTAPLPPPR